MADCGHTLFATVLGPCGIAWGPRGVLAVQLPEADEARTRERMLRGCGVPQEACPAMEAPPSVRHAIEGIQALLAGEPRDLREVVLDMERLSEFHRRVYAHVRAIPPGSTRSYGEVAEALGDKSLARAVGQAMGYNPFAPVVPCHRVLAAGQRSGGFSAQGGARTKLRMLEIEGARLGAGGERGLFDAD